MLGEKDKDEEKNVPLSPQEFSVEKEYVEHFGSRYGRRRLIGAKEYNETTTLRLSDYGAIASGWTTGAVNWMAIRPLSFQEASRHPDATTNSPVKGDAARPRRAITTIRCGGPMARSSWPTPRRDHRTEGVGQREVLP